MTADADRRPRPSGGPLFLGVGGIALAGSVALWWHAWSGGPASTMTCACTDAGRMLWYLEWFPFAVAHGAHPWFSTWLFAPNGFNLLWDTSVPALAVALSPVTAAFGPVVAVNVASTLAPVAAALSAAWFLRRWVTRPSAVAVGALVYAFAPYVVVQLAYGWLNQAWVALVPLFAGTLDELLLRQRRDARLVGAALGGLAALQFLISSEILVVLVISGTLAGAILVGYAGLARRRALVARWRHAAVGLAAAALAGGVLLAYPVWFFFAGPGHLHGTVWSTAVPGQLGNTFGNFWHSIGQWGGLDTRQLAAQAHALGGYGGPPLPSPSYLGPGLLAVLATGTLVWRSDRRLWCFGAVGLLTAAVGLRDGPWLLVEHLPLLDNVVQSRFSAVTNLCAVAMLAVILARTADALSRRSRPTARATRAWAAAAPTLAVAAAAIVPIAVVLAPNLPVAMRPTAVPRWFAQRAPHLPPGQVLLTYPFATADSQTAVAWQAIEGLPYRMAGGGGPSGTPARAGHERPGFTVLRDASTPLAAAPVPSAANLAAVRSAVAAWHVTMAVVPVGAHLPAFARGRGSGYGVAFYTAVFGHPPVTDDGALVWTGLRRAPPVPIGAAALERCASLGATRATVACVLAHRH